MREEGRVRRRRLRLRDPIFDDCQTTYRDMLTEILKCVDVGYGSV